jgi:hypothetical protein
MGNIFGRLQGSDKSAGAVLTGSHCDAIPLAGELVIKGELFSQMVERFSFYQYIKA